MSGVYFPGVQKPEKTEKCKFYQSVPFRGPYCAMYNICYGLEQCPAVYVPDHGQLIDGDKIGLTDFEIYMCSVQPNSGLAALKMLVDKLEKAPIIIPADVTGRDVRCKDDEARA